MGHIKASLPPSLDPFQFAYCPNQSTNDAILFDLCTILSHLDRRNSYARILFIDFSLAFNNIIPQQLKEKLSLLGQAPLFVTRFWTSSQKGHKQSVLFTKTITHHHIEQGAPFGLHAQSVAHHSAHT